MRLQQRLLGLAASLLLVGILVGLPAALWTIGPSVLPDTLPSWGQVWQSLTRPDDGTLALRVIKAVGWTCWLVMTVLIVVELVARTRGGHVPRPSVPALRAPQSAVRGLVGTALLLFTATSGVGMAQAATATTVAAAAPSAPTTSAAPTGAEAPTSTAQASAQEQEAAPTTAETRSHTVRQGESLWSIAETHLGEGIRYSEIRDFNRETLGDDPGFLDPGTVLKLPASPAAATEKKHTVTVQPGETLSGIADRELADPNEYRRIAEANEQVSDPDDIEAGQTLTIPKGSATSGQPERHHEDGSTEKPAPKPTPTPAPTREHSTPERTADEPRPQSSAPSTAERERTSPTQEASEVPAEDSGSGWMLAGLTGGGAVLAGGILMKLHRHRRAQHRHRRAGRTIATPEPALGPVEKTVNAMGTVTAPTLERMDSALRRLASTQAAQGLAMPDLAAVELGLTRIGLHLSSPATLADPWEGSEDGLQWYLPSGDEALEAIGEPAADQPAPYPLLVTLGATDAGETWLLNLEELDLSITGDTNRGRDVARYLAAELAVNPWSHGVRVDLVGVAEEVAEMDLDRIRTHTDGEDPAAEVLADAVTMIDRSGELGADVATARASQAGADTWHARLLLVDAAEERPAALNQLLDLLASHGGRTGASVVVRGEDEEADGLKLHVSSTGRITIPSVGLELAVVGLTSDEARGCAAILTQGEQLEDVPVPVREDATEGWRAWSDEAGALREEHARERTATPSDEEETTSVLEAPDEEYIESGATTAADLQAMAPRVPTHVSEAVREADPSLDEDLAAWWAPDCPLPRLSLLGPVTARTLGSAVTKRKGYYTEILAYLATRAAGATPAEVAEAFGVSPAKARDYVKIVRHWLGTNPTTGTPHLPDARYAPAAQARGQGVYEVLDVLVDADLFRRLRVRGEAQGPDGIEDLDAALRLVSGRPFDGLRPGGWYWLSEGDRLDQHMICAIVDVAHLVTTFALKAGDLKRARLAAETAALAAPDEEIPRLDLAAVADAEGHGNQADRILRDEVFNRSDDEGAPPELPERTQQIVTSKDWAERARRAS